MKVSVSEAKAKLPALLARVEAGETIIITKRGAPIATIVPPRIEHVRAEFETPALLAPKPRPARGLSLAEILKASR